MGDTTAKRKEAICAKCEAIYVYNDCCNCPHLDEMRDAQALVTENGIYIGPSLHEC